MEVEVDEVAFEIVARSGQGQNNNNKLKSSLFALAHIQSEIVVFASSNLLHPFWRPYSSRSEESYLQGTSSIRCMSWRCTSKLP